MINIINEIVEKNIVRLKNNPNIISIFLVGSMASTDYYEKELNDYDIRFIVNEMNADTYKDINKILMSIKCDIEKSNIGCQVSDVIGPVKMVPVARRNVLIHSITMTEKELDSLPKIHRYSYSSNYRQIYGKDLIAKYKDIVINPNDIILATEGIDFCINLINTKENSYTKWINDSGTMTLKREYVKATDNDMLELFYYSYKKAIDNINNMIKTNNFKVDLNVYLDFDEEEKELTDKINNNSLTTVDISDKSIKILEKVLLKLAQLCLKIYKQNKKYYNSLEWGIIDQDSREVRKNGFDHIKKIKLPTGHNFSVGYHEYQVRKTQIADMIKDSKYIVIFEPPNKSNTRYGITSISSIDQIDEYIIKNNYNLQKYNVSFIEIINELQNSFAGTVMTDGNGNTIIETIDGTCDSRELTSIGANAKHINSYRFMSFDDNDSNVPRIIREIKEMCQYFRGYYEFAYGEIRGIKDIYFTFYSPNENYINIFEGGKIKCKNITK